MTWVAAWLPCLDIAATIVPRTISWTWYSIFFIAVTIFCRYFNFFQKSTIWSNISHWQPNQPNSYASTTPRSEVQQSTDQYMDWTLDDFWITWIPPTGNISKVSSVSGSPVQCCPPFGWLPSPPSSFAPASLPLDGADPLQSAKLKWKRCFEPEIEVVWVALAWCVCLCMCAYYTYYCRNKHSHIFAFHLRFESYLLQVSSMRSHLCLGKVSIEVFCR